MDSILISSIITVVSFAVFIGIIYWAYNKHNKSKFEAIGQSLLEIDTDTTGK